MYIRLGGLGAAENGVVCTAPADCTSGTCCKMPNGLSYCMSDPAACLQMISSCVIDPTMRDMPICKPGSGGTPSLPPGLPGLPSIPGLPPTLPPGGGTTPPGGGTTPPPSKPTTIFGMSPMVAGAVGLVALLVGIKVFKG